MLEAVPAGLGQGQHGRDRGRCRWAAGRPWWIASVARGPVAAGDAAACSAERAVGVGGVGPAARQRLAGGKAQLVFGEMVRILQLLAAVDPPQNRRGEGVGQLAQIQHLDQGCVVLGPWRRSGGPVLVKGEEHRRGLCGGCDSPPEDGRMG